MNSFTQRLMDRASARRQKLNTYLSNIGNEASEPRTPLQEQNVHHLLKIKTEVEVSLNKPGTSSTCTVGSIKVSPNDTESTKENSFPFKRTNSFKCSATYTISSEHNSEEEKSENEDTCNSDTEDQSAKIVDMKTKNTMRENTRSYLKRLGALYSDEPLSSPIHRTEEKFIVEDVEDEPVATQEECSSNTKRAGLPRLAALASTINSWEDDISHQNNLKSPNIERKNYDAGRHMISKNTPNATVLKDNKNEKHNSVNNVVKGSKSDDKKDKPSPGKLVLNEDIVNKLESQGFYRTPDSRLIYDCDTPSPQGNNKPTRSPAKISSPTHLLSPIKSRLENQRIAANSSNNRNSPRMGVSNLKGSPSKPITSPMKTLSSPSNFPVMGVKASPRKHPESPKAGSVLHKATMFELQSPTKKVVEKDPAELPLSERLAMFEGKRGAALIPKAPFAMAIPTNKDKKKVSAKPLVLITATEHPTSPNAKVDYPAVGPTSTSSKEKGENSKIKTGKNLLPQLQIFESGAASASNTDKIVSAKKEREKELEMLNNRWNANKAYDMKEVQNTDGKKIEPVASPSTGFPSTHSANGQTNSEALPPQKKEVHFNRDVIAIQPINESMASTLTDMSFCPSPPAPPPLPPSDGYHSKETISPRMENNYYSSRLHDNKKDFKYPGMIETKKIKVSPLKPGRLYPSLSDIEATTETESDMQDITSRSASSEDFNSSSDGNTSFGKEIFRAAGFSKSLIDGPDENQADSSDMSEAESVLNDMDEFLNEALADDSDSDNNAPTPPKKKRETPEKSKKYSPTTSQSHSFKYTRGSPGSTTTDEDALPLMHTVSFYRRQQNMSANSTPVRKIVKRVDTDSPSSEGSSIPENDDAITQKIQELLDEVTKQQNVISQTSQAINLCLATLEFSGSLERVAAERLLLLATHRRQAALNEIQRLRVEGTLKPMTGCSTDSSHLLDRGALIIWSITLPFKKSHLCQLAADNKCAYFMCLVRSQEQVLATQVVAATSQNIQKNTLSITFPGSLRLEGLYSDFKVTLEIFTMETPKEILPHDVKYHINKKDKSRVTPKKLLKHESQLVMPRNHSPAGPSAVLSPSFQMAGYIVFSLREVERTSFTLNKVPYTSPLDGTIQLKMNSELTLDVTVHGFLTMFDVVGGFSAWHRRWCLLKGASISFWKYPDDERNKEPIGKIDLNKCITETVGLVSRDICARPHTFLLETTRISRPDDENSLVLTCGVTHTTLRHLISADTKEERIRWCSQINKSLTMLRAWRSTDSSKH